MSFPLKGACQCGQVQFEVLQMPKMVIACHCKECQKLATAPFSVTAVMAADDIRFFGELKEWQRSSDSGNINAAKFCGTCGNRVYHFNPADPSTIKLKLKPVELEDDTIFEPTAHVWTDEKVSWFTIPEGVKSFAQQP